jgi:hypothetical protein
MNVGEVREFAELEEREASLLRRSAHNINSRGNKYFITRYRDGIVTVTRLK